MAATAAMHSGVLPARDVALFARHGYRARAFQPVDLFPQTEHLEVACWFAPEKTVR